MGANTQSGEKPRLSLLLLALLCQGVPPHHVYAKSHLKCYSVSIARHFPIFIILREYENGFEPVPTKGSYRPIASHARANPRLRRGRDRKSPRRPPLP